MNRLYLFHRPTGQYTLAATRRSFGWRPAGTPDSLHRALDAMFQKAANGLAGLPPDAHQDDFLVVMDDARGAAHAYDIHHWDEQERIVLDPLLSFGPVNGELDESLLSLRRTLRALLVPEAEVQEITDPAKVRAIKAIDRLRQENEELRAGVVILAELVRINAERMALEDRGVAAALNKRGDWALAWVRAQAWVEEITQRVRRWA